MALETVQETNPIGKSITMLPTSNIKTDEIFIKNGM